MKITDVKIEKFSAPRSEPFRVAFGVIEDSDSWTVKITTDEGIYGLGSAAPIGFVTGETMETCYLVMKMFAEAFIGFDPMDIAGAHKLMDSIIYSNGSAKCAFDIALYDIMGKKKNLPVYKLLGGTDPVVHNDITVGIDTPEKMRDAAERFVSQKGFDILKIKVGKEGLADVERVAAIRRAVGPAIQLRVDANQGWSAEQSISIIRAMEDQGLDIELVEQPVPAHDLAGLKEVTQAVDTPILADEAVFSHYDAARLIQEKAADLINIKLMKTGGIWQALKICRMAAEHGVECMIGCMLESRLSVAAAAHLAAGQAVITRADLDGPSLCAVDPYSGGPVFDGPTIAMSDDPGVGVDDVPCREWT